MRFLLLSLRHLLLAILLCSSAHADTLRKDGALRYNCRGWMPIYLDSWVPINPDPSDFDPLTVEVNPTTGMTSFVLTMIGHANFATRISDAHVKGAIAFRKLMVDDMIEFVDFHLNRGTGELNITALEKSRRAHPLYRGRCQLYKSPF